MHLLPLHPLNLISPVPCCLCCQLGLSSGCNEEPRPCLCNERGASGRSVIDLVLLRNRATDHVSEVGSGGPVIHPPKKSTGSRKCFLGHVRAPPRTTLPGVPSSAGRRYANAAGGRRSALLGVWGSQRGARAAGHEQARSPPPPPLARRPAARERQDGVHAATDLRPAGLPPAPSAAPPAPAG